MANETDNTTANMTENVVDVVEESGMLDNLMDSPELLLCVAVIAALASYVAYTQPALRALALPYVNKFLKTHEAKIEELLDTNLTKAQKLAYAKLDATLQSQGKDEILRNGISTAWDEKDDELKALVKGKVKTALDNVK